MEGVGIRLGALDMTKSIYEDASPYMYDVDGGLLYTTTGYEQTLLNRTYSHANRVLAALACD